MSIANKNARFDDAVSRLRGYTDSSSDKALLSALLATGSNAGVAETTLDAKLEKLADNLVSVVKGGVFVSEFAKSMDDFIGDDKDTKEAVKGFLRITFPYETNVDKKADLPCYVNSKQLYGGDNTEFTLAYAGLMNNENVLPSTKEKCSVPESKKSPTLYAIELINPRLGMTTRDAAPLSIFTSLISTVEMSRCVPYINTRITVSGSSPIDSVGRLQGLSLVTYLNGAGSIQSLAVGDAGENVFDMIMLERKVDNEILSQVSSMEVFTSPQTLVSPPNSHAFNPTSGYTRALDRFRPFMSLNSLSFNVSPTTGWLSYKTAQMEITLHDRSRLAQIAPFIKPDIYQGTEFDIEYGWSHPSGNAGTAAEENPVGVFLDGLKVREKYAIVNASFSFDDAGQVNISLTLAMKGASALQTVDVSMAKTQSASQALKEAIVSISKKIEELRGKGGEKFNRLYDETILNAVSSESSALSLDEEALKTLQVKLSSLKKSKDADKTLVEDIERLIGVNGEVQIYKKSVDAAVDEQIKEIFNGNEIFPCTDSQAGSPSLKKVTIGDISDSPSDATVENSISFGKLLLGLVGKPLAKSGKYDEVQFIFHTFNEYSTFMRDLSIAKYPIAKAELDEKLKEVLKTNMKVSCMQVMQLLVEFINDPSAVPYGFRQLYEPAKDDDGNLTGGYERRTIDTDDEKKQEAYRVYQSDYENYVISKAGIPNGKFKMPKVTVYPECIPANSDSKKSILRMHVIDETSSSFGTLFDLIKANRSGDITAFGLMNSPTHPLLTKAPETNSTKTYANRKAVLEKMIEKEVVTRVVNESPPDSSQTQTGDAVTVEIDVGKLLEGKSIEKTKRFVSQGLPTILFGRGSGMVTSAGLTSLNDPQLATVNMMRMSKENSATPELSRSRGLPLRIAPTEVSVEMLGLPIVQYMQYVFMDFSTGTTADNIYAITGIEHKISAGEFTTSLKLTAPADAYAEYESPKKKLEIQSDLLRAALGLPPAEKKAPSRPKPPSGVGTSSRGSSGGSGGGGGGGGSGSGGAAPIGSASLPPGVNSAVSDSVLARTVKDKFFSILAFTPEQIKKMNEGCIVCIDYVNKTVVNVWGPASVQNIPKEVLAFVSPSNPSSYALVSMFGLRPGKNGNMKCRVYDAQGANREKEIMGNLYTWLATPLDPASLMVWLNAGEPGEWEEYSKLS